MNSVVVVADCKRTSNELNADALTGAVQDRVTAGSVVGVGNGFMVETGLVLTRCCHGTPAPAWSRSASLTVTVGFGPPGVDQPAHSGRDGRGAGR